jgi:hypothetical protein
MGYPYGHAALTQTHKNAAGIDLINGMAATPTILGRTHA